MKRFLLTSYGITNQKIADALFDLVGKKDFRTLIIAEAHYKKLSDKRWFIEELKRYYDYIPGKIDFVNLFGQSRDEILQHCELADVIYVVGGGAGILSGVFEKTGFDRMLTSKLLDEKVYMGSSAGSMILTKVVDNPEFWTALLTKPGMPVESSDEKLMGVVNFGFVPHLNRPDRPFKTTENMTRILANNPFPVYGVEDSQAVVVRGDEITFVGDGEIQIFGRK